MKDYLQIAGQLSLASRMKRTSEVLYNSVDQYYKKQNIKFKGHWFPFFMILKYEELTSPVEISKALGISYPAVIKIAKQLEAEKLLSISKNKEDSRITEYRLSQKGKKLLLNLAPHWSRIKNAVVLLESLANTNLCEQLKEVEYILKNNTFEELIQRSEND